MSWNWCSEIQTLVEEEEEEEELYYHLFAKITIARFNFKVNKVKSQLK